MKKKGFTLIELLAVIVILAIIALIAVPVIMNIITSVRKSAFEDTAYGLISAGEMYYAQELLENGMTSDVEFTIEDGEFVGTNKLEVKGALPSSGSIKVTRDGKVAIAISNGAMCITKGYDDSKIDSESDIDNCELPVGELQPGTLAYLARKTTFSENVVNACATDGTTCAVGTKFAIEVAPNVVKNFYVISDVDNTVTMLMDRNVDETKVAWISETDYGCGVAGSECSTNEKGPITALSYLESQTNGWTNIPAKTYTLTDNIYGTMERANVRARMLTETEANAIISNNWSYENLDAGISLFGYWTSSAHEEYSSSAWWVGSDGNVDYTDSVWRDIGYGVRPVIEISK
ncbi:MAG: DUF1566 domain-containing protein [Firmicutes bacterium]|nr:DUF1566 domain-containing protein [Bacillota bacterium]